MPLQPTGIRFRSSGSLLWSCYITLFVACALKVCGAGFTIVDVGTLGGNYSLGYGINSNGFVVGESSPQGNATHAFLYRITNIVDLSPGQPAGSAYGSGHALNNANQSVGQLLTNGQYRAGLFSGSGVRTDLGTLGGDYSDAHAINDAGQIVGEAITSFATGGNDHAFLRGTTVTNLIDLGTLGGSYSSALGINNFGHVVGEADSLGNGTHAFFYDGTNMTDLGTFGGRDSSAAAVNDSDQVTGYAVTSDSKAHAFVFSGGVMQDLGTLGGLESAGNSINSSGQIVGYYTFVPNSSTVTHAFYYDGTAMFDLNFLIPANSGWKELTSAQGVNDARQICGYGINSNGQTRAFLLKPDTNSSVAVSLQPDQIVAVGGTVTFTNRATDLVNPTNTFTFSLDPGFPAGATIDPNTGVFTWTAPLTSDSLTTNVVTVRATAIGDPTQTGTGAMRIVVVGRPRFIGMTSNIDGTISQVWSTYPNYTYTLQYKTSLSDAQWTDITTTVATDVTQTFTDAPLADTQRFYQVTSALGTSDPAGFIVLTALGNSDSFISMPFTRGIAAVAFVNSASSNVLTIQPQNWADNQFVYSAGVQTNTYYVRFETGAAAGLRYLITANTGSTLTLNLGTDSLSAVAQNDRVSIIPCWTMGSMFPNGSGVNVSPTVGNRYTEVLTPDLTSSGINLSAAKIYFFNAGLWKQLGQGAGDHGTDFIPPSTYVIVRHNVPTNTTIMTMGAVSMSPLATSLMTSSVTPRDNAVALPRPVITSLDNSGLVASGGFAASPFPGSHTDELLTFDNTVAQRNKSSSAIYYYWSGGWRRVGAGATIVGADQVFQPGVGVIIRKGTNSVPSLWLNSPAY
jgi:uncharacterized protein (TIGR02597 family)